MSAGAVKLKTPLRTLKQVGKELGMNDARQAKIISMVRDSKGGKFVPGPTSDKSTVQKRAKN